MWGLQPFAKTAFAALIGFQIVVLALRSSSSGTRGEIFRLGALLAFLGARLFLSPDSPVSAPLSVLIVWAAGEFLLDASGRSASAVWGLSNAANLAVLIVISILGYEESLPLIAFRGFSLGLFGLVPLALLLRLSLKTGSVIDALSFVSAALFLAAGGVELVLDLREVRTPDLCVWPIGLLACCTGYVIFQEGYLQKNNWRSFESRLSGQEAQKRGAYARLLLSERAMALQDKLTASGLLALGIAHEFKNTLAHIKATAERGLRTDQAGEKDESLKLLMEHADAGGRSAVGFLERLSREGREKQRPLRMEEVIGGFLRLVRATYRAEGVLFRVQSAGARALGRRGEIEQILFNLAANAVESFRRNQPPGERFIEVACCRRDDAVLVEVKDNAGGVPSDQVGRLFHVSPSPAGGTGLGLYLSRGLAERNGGSLTYAPREDGSCFTLALQPAEERADPEDGERT
jgi:signal transduction histidine kinase